MPSAEPVTFIWAHRLCDEALREAQRRDGAKGGAPVAQSAGRAAARAGQAKSARRTKTHVLTKENPGVRQQGFININITHWLELLSHLIVPCGCIMLRLQSPLSAQIHLGQTQAPGRLSRLATLQTSQV